MPTIIKKSSRKVVNSILSVALGLSTLVWLGGFAVVSPTAEAQTTADTIAALQAQIAALQAQLVALSGQTATPTTGGMLTKQLYQGLRDSEVTTLQTWLKTLPSVYPEGLVTGYFGALTKAAVLRYQASKGIAQVGQVGPQTRAALNAQFGGTSGGGTTPPPVSGSQVGVSLAPTTPAAGVMPTMATGVKMMSFNLTAPFSGAVTVTDIVVHRGGVGAASDFNQVYLYDGDSRLTSGRTVNSASNNAEFHNLSITVPAGTTKTIDVVADMSATGAATGNVNYFELVSASSVGSTAAVTGSFPIRGNNFTVAGATGGTVTITDLVPSTTPKVGDQNVKVAAFSLGADSSEDVSLRRITLYNGGNLSSGGIGNFKLQTAGATIATAASIDSKGYVVFVLPTPYVVTKGNTINFEVFADILSGARANDTITFKLDQSTDLYAVGNTYGYGAKVTNSMSTGTTLTVLGGQVTISFNGPSAQNWAKGTTGAELLNFSISTKNNTEFRALNFTFTTSAAMGDGSNTYFTNFRVLDTTTNQIIAGPSDAATSGTSKSYTFTDRFNLNAGQTHNYKVLVDISNSASAMTASATLLATSFTTAGNVKNVDNNTNITDIVPSTNIGGNTQTVLAQRLDLALAGTPVSQSYVRGSQNVDLVGFNFTAGQGGDAKVSSITTTTYYSDSSTGTAFAVGATASSRFLSLKLIDKATGNQVGTAQAVSSTNGTSVFSGLDITVPAGQTKTIVVRGDMTNNTLAASNFEYYKVDVASSGNVTSADTKGNSITITTSGSTYSAANSGTATGTGTIVTVMGTGAITVAKAPNDTESQQQIVLAGASNVPLAKFRVTASNEDLKMNKARFTVAAGAVDSLNALTLWDGPTQLAGPVIVSSAGVADFYNINFSVPKDTSKVLTVKGNLNTIAAGADSGDEILVTFDSDDNFEVVGTSPGSSTQLTSYTTEASGNTMTLRKTKPTIALVNPSSTKLVTGTVELARLNITADAAEQLAVEHITLSFALTSATFTADSLVLYDLDTAQSLTATDTVAATGGTGQITLNPEVVIPAGATKHFAIKATVSAISSTVGASAIQTSLPNASDTAVATGALSGGSLAAETVGGTAYDFIWSDYSTVGHSQSSSDYTNARDLKDFTNTIVITN